MAELTPLFMDVNNVYSGDELGLPLRHIVKEGVLGSNALKVQAKGTPNLSVDVLAGSAFVLGDTNVDRQPNYLCINDGTVNKGITPDPSNPRKVLVVAQVVDEAFAGTGRLWRIDAIHGTPSGSPAEPALPASALPLALVDVTAGDTDITNAQITDRRVQASSALSGVYDRALTTVDINNVSTEQIIYSKSIEPGAMGTDKTLRLLLMGDYLHNNVAGDTITTRVKFGATTFWAASLGSIGGTADADRHPWRWYLDITNLGANNSQAISGHLSLALTTDATPTTGIGGASAQFEVPFGASGLGAIDTSLAKTLEVTVQWSAASANNSWRRRAALLELI